MSADSASSWTSVKDFIESSGRRAVIRFQRTQWDQLCLIAANANRHLQCVALDQVTSGANNIVRLLQFSDGSRWAARVPIKGSAELETEVATMQYINEHSGLAVPRVFTNIMADENFSVTGIIDWEGARTVPWELVAFPEFLQAMPPSFDLPYNYDAHGQPLGEELRQRWRERQDYIEMVRSAEIGDNLLSTCLGSNRSQALAYAYGAFTSIGKLGFYDRVVEELERETRIPSA